MTVLSESERDRRAREWTDAKRCSACGETKPQHAFQASSGRRDGVYPYCRDCTNERQRARYRSDPDYRARQAARKKGKKHETEQAWRQANPTCPRCGKWPRRVAASGMVASHCSPCESAVGKLWRASLPTARRSVMDRAAHLARWSMTAERYDAILERQGGGCAICGGLNTNGRKLAIDHDHSCCPGKGSCGKCVRGLLCGPCNTGIGSFHEDLERLASAIVYLRR